MQESMKHAACAMQNLRMDAGTWSETKGARRPVRASRLRCATGNQKQQPVVICARIRGSPLEADLPIRPPAWDGVFPQPAEIHCLTHIHTHTRTRERSLGTPFHPPRAGRA